MSAAHAVGGESATPPSDVNPRLPRQPRDERLEVLARMLRDRPGRSATWIAEDFDVSVRTVRRDIAMLRTRGTPVAGARGRTGGLRLDPEWGVSRVHLSTADALCTLMAMTIVEHMGATTFPESVARVQTALVAAFPHRERCRIESLRARLVVGPRASAEVRASYGAVQPQTVRALERAFVEQRVVWLRFRNDNGTTTRRRLEPHALLVNAPAWYLLAFDSFPGTPRALRYDRLLHVEPIYRRFEARPDQVARDLLTTDGVPLQP